MAGEHDQPRDTKQSSFALWFGLPIGLILFYLLLPGPLRWAVEKNYVPLSLMKPLETVYFPLEWAYEHNAWVHRFYDGYFRMLGLTQ